MSRARPRTSPAARAREQQQPDERHAAHTPAASEADAPESAAHTHDAPESAAAVSAASTPAAPAPAGAFVAVIVRRGRFLTAEPLFAHARRESGDGRARRRAPARVTLGSTRSGRSGGAGARAGEGELALVAPPTHRGGARVVRVLGRPNVARDVIEGLLLDRGLARGFHRAVEEEAQAAARRVRERREQRRDLRDLPTFTIDPASARDFDDAISAEVIDGAGADAVRVWVHIADVAAHVPDGSLVDREARTRATSVYAPSAVEPMLPHSLSSDACSLMPGVERAAVSVELELHGARVVRSAFHRSLIRSDRRLHYEQVDRIFAGAERAAEPWGAALRAARSAAAALQAERERAGALVVDSPEPEFQFDEQGDVIEGLLLDRGL
ncbi:MAG TPA: ribonuclease catalytic domain-containing protein, partial [Solirubrobacteraceae bacterium]|nr:ribonuclease catalytic domain-containing protein [Solirubrobacteraceae bacterium]